MRWCAAGLALSFEAGDPVGAAQFWAELLGREVIESAAECCADGTVVLADPDGDEFSVREAAGSAAG